MFRKYLALCIIFGVAFIQASVADWKLRTANTTLATTSTNLVVSTVFNGKVAGIANIQYLDGTNLTQACTTTCSVVRFGQTNLFAATQVFTSQVITATAAWPMVQPGDELRFTSTYAGLHIMIGYVSE
jgi:hypothetical protein